MTDREPTSAEVEALKFAVKLAENGVPVFVARPGDGPKRFRVASGWQNTTPNPRLLEAWRPGLAVAMVCGHGRDVIDLDPRNGFSFDVLPAGALEAHCGVVATPSGGWHVHVAALGVAKRGNVLPGVDVQAGAPDGKGRGFVFLPPTPGYTWLEPPAMVQPRDRPHDALLALLERPADPPSPTPGSASSGSQDHTGPIPKGQRDDAITRYAARLAGLGISRAEAERLLKSRWSDCEQPPGDPFTWAEALGKLDSAWSKYHRGERVEIDLPRRPELVGSVNGMGAATLPAPALPEDFWTARPELAHIRQAAWSRGRSAEAVLGTALARVAADTLHVVKLPASVGARCGLSLIVALTGRPGSGKSSSKAIAVELLPARNLKPECDDVPPGSGEGLVELLFEYVKTEDGGKEKRQTRHNVFAYVDEGEVLAVQARRSSSNTILPVMRTVFTDGTLGQANASQERKRRVAGGQYVCGIVLAIQPGKAGELFADAGGGTPQRFLWAPTGAPVPAPGQRPAWPGRLELPPVRPATAGAYTLTLADPVRHVLEHNDHQRQQHGCDPLDQHADLIRLKVAGILAVMAGRLDISEADWHLAGMVMQVSDATRARVLVELAQQERERNLAAGQAQGERQVASNERISRSGVRQARQAIMRKLTRAAGQWVRRTPLRDACGQYREFFEAAIGPLIEDGLVDVEEYEHNGVETARYRLAGHTGGSRA